MSSIKYTITFVETDADYDDITEEELTKTVQAIKEYVKDVISVRFNTERDSVEVDLEAVVS